MGYPPAALSLAHYFYICPYFIPSCAVCYSIGYTWACSHYEYIRGLQGLKTRHSYMDILYHKSLYNDRHITLHFIYLKIKKKIYENAKNEKKSTEKNEDGVNPYPLHKLVALFCPKKNNFFYGVIFTRTKREQNNTIKIWYNMPIINKLTRSPRSTPDPPTYPQSYPQADLCYSSIDLISLIKYTKKYCIIKKCML